MRSVWAVARVTILESIRSKFVVVFAVLLAVCVLGVGLSFKGDGTLKGRIQTFLDYSTVLTQLLLSLLTVMLGAYVTSADIRSKTIFTVVSKPLGRPAYVVGRWLGVSLLAAVLLALSMGSIYVLARHLGTLPTRIERQKALGELPAGVRDPQRRAINSEVFTARAARQPDPLNVEAILKREMDWQFERFGKDQLIQDFVRQEMIRASRDRTKSPSDEEVKRRAARPEVRRRVLEEIRRQTRKRILEQLRVVQPGGAFPLSFSGVRAPPADQSLQLRYKLRPLRRPDSGLIKSFWYVRNPENGLQAGDLRDDPVDAASVYEIDPRLVTSKGNLYVMYRNDPSNTTAVKVVPDDIHLMYRVGGFGGNVLRAGAVMMIRLAFLAAVGILFGSFLSFPVAALASLVVLFTGLMGDFVQEATKLPRYTTPDALDYLSFVLARGAFLLLPKLPVLSSPAEALRNGTIISWQDLSAELALDPRIWNGSASSALKMVLGVGTGLRALLALGIAALIFRSRELARVQV